MKESSIFSLSTWSEGLCSEAGGVEGEGGEATVAGEEETLLYCPFFDSPKLPPKKMTTEIQ